MTTLFDLAAGRARAREVFGLPELTDPVAIEAEAWDATARVILGDPRDWQPTGFVQALGDDPDDREIREVPGDVVSDSAYVEANVETLADIVALYRELRQARAKLAAVETLAGGIFRIARHSDYGNGRWDVADRIMRILGDGT